MKHLIVTADDFGRSPEINAAILRAHRAGFVTQASVMVHEPAAAEAAEIARAHPALRVGLHLTLCAGRAAEFSALTQPHGPGRPGSLQGGGPSRPGKESGSAQFTPSPMWAGLRYALTPALREPLRREIRAQFARFRELAFAPSYWDGHTHLHLHPTILRLTLPIAVEHGFRAVRLVREPGPFAVVPWIFQRLSRAAMPHLERHGMQFSDHTFGLRATGRMTNATITRLLAAVPDGTSELYFHPGAEPEETAAATHARQLAERGVMLTSF